MQYTRLLLHVKVNEYYNLTHCNVYDLAQSILSFGKSGAENICKICYLEFKLFAENTCAFRKEMASSLLILFLEANTFDVVFTCKLLHFFLF